jgi:uncharacterized membrane protein
MRKPHLDDKARWRMKQAQLRRCRNPALADVIERNICTLLEIREEFEQSKGPQDRVADAITRFSGSMFFVYIHMAWFGLWIGMNLGWLGTKPFDPYPFGLLTMVVSLEAIFLSTFVLVSQNRMGMVADKRADLDVQINLLAEHEITRILMLVDAMAEQMGIKDADDPEIRELSKDVAPEEVLQELEKRAHERSKASILPD